MNDFFKSVLVILISVTLSMQWCNSHFEKKLEIQKLNTLIVQKTQPTNKIITVTNYFTITNYVTVTNFLESSINTLSLGVPLQQNTQTVLAVDIQPPIEHEIRLRQIAKELTDLLDGIEIRK